MAKITLILLLLATPAYAQEAASSFEELRTRIGPGDNVYVTDIAGTVRHGRIAELSPGSLMLHPSNGNPPYIVLQDQVNNIAVRRADSLWNGMLIGLSIGAIPGLLLDLAVANEYQTFSLGATTGLGVFGLGIGTLVDALHKTTRTIYIRPALARSSIGVHIVVGN